ncbi:hypothetical protein HAX54_025033 [Datura stramonium]|uniref:Cytochrome P450 n=1 Tax=Datura stramonium TaxID=4076 RepID=A0ABS8V0Z9_DATST|nr:hypothetical protein [Datura stramonium]
MRASGGTYLFKGLWFANMDILTTVDPANVHYIMSANFMNFPKGPKFKEMFDVLGNGIFNADLDMEGLCSGLERFCSKGSLLTQLVYWSNGYDPGCIYRFSDVPFSKAMDDAEEAILFRHALPEIKLRKEDDYGSETLDYTIDKYISKKREDLKERGYLKESEEGFDLLTFYLKEEESLGVKCDDKFLRDNILNLMIAGRDTTSSALTWFIWLRPINPQVEEKIRDEINSCYPR